MPTNREIRDEDHLSIGCLGIGRASQALMWLKKPHVCRLKALQYSRFGNLRYERDSGEFSALNFRGKTL